ncbi:phosphopantetheine-binding protein [Streptomyces kanamyceticus]|uniref:Acyl carrier protein n=1 Tax=Streptomyces kanamyceticus TaxID=1967 RepID=A0A5J6GP28_STRKN|nr:phosphopantetheine-binding protein [Streptomyces kanamyceticus]QEU95745.1 acyl carrier protein [Streptomyces kanamyceticus]
MQDLDDFVFLVSSEIGIPVTRDNVGASFDELPRWDSMLMLALLVMLERETQRRIAVPDALESTSLLDLYELAVAP